MTGRPMSANEFADLSRVNDRGGGAQTGRVATAATSPTRAVPRSSSSLRSSSQEQRAELDAYRLKLLADKKLERRLLEEAERRGRAREAEVAMAPFHPYNKRVVVEREEGGLMICCICLDRPMAMAVLPCRHPVFCRECSDAWMRRPPDQSMCPICRGPVEEMVLVHIVNKDREQQSCFAPL
ncbi:unnamed protein product [Vitrella brassicaformis CCMP3155]|uniref:RING-type domain-containing protein n=1 Tax=Vitrella brassicaformis (strain CCMP3155) TaxID=1169540 RepID=A0A0G4H1F6_VITBC|nr:unnamed protein product [Vitrella brassicaformis CCMP3155]|eukprot:CEM37426.1 unnamed protein product [Vitrella brassicaformis CCMP3155]